MTERAEPKWRRGIWLDATVIVSVMAVGTVVAGLLEEPSVEIPGCDHVEPATEPRRFNMAYSPSQEYDNANYPWFSGPKATAMTDAILESLPDDVDVVFSSPVQTFEFQPIDDVAQSQLPDDVDAGLFNGSTGARGALV